MDSQKTAKDEQVVIAEDQSKNDSALAQSCKEGSVDVEYTEQEKRSVVRK